MKDTFLRNCDHYSGGKDNFREIECELCVSVDIAARLRAFDDCVVFLLGHCM